MKKLFYSGAGIILWHKDKDGIIRIALEKRRNHLAFGGMWSIAGGRKEKGESFRRAACRELAEEIGVSGGYTKPRLNEFLFTGFYNFITFKAQIIAETLPELTPQYTEVSQCIWFPLDELPENLCPSARRQIGISNIPRASSYKRKWELYASIAKKLMIEHDYNVYFTDLFKFYTDETKTEVNKNGKEILKQNVDFLSEAIFPSGKDPYTLLLKEIDRIEPERIIILGNKSEKNIKANIKNVNAEVKKVIHPSAYNGITAETIIDQIFNNNSISFDKGVKTSDEIVRAVTDFENRLKLNF